MIAPALKKLRLRHFLFPIKCPSLRHLSLMDMSVTVEQCLEIFSSVPLLEELIIANSLVRSLAPYSSKHISFSQLKFVSLKGNPGGCLAIAQLWTHIVVPSDTVVHIVHRQNDSFQTEESVVELDAFLDAVHAHAFQPLHDTFTLTRTVTLRSLTIALRPSSQQHTPSNFEPFTLCLILGTVRIREGWSSVIRKVSGRAATHARFLFLTPYPCDEALARLVNVEIIHVRAMSGGSSNTTPLTMTSTTLLELNLPLLRLLQSLAHNQTNAAFPVLHTVIFDEPPPSCMLYTVLNRRRSHSAPILRLVLRGNIASESERELEAERGVLKDIEEVVGELVDERRVRFLLLSADESLADYEFG
jgi:hypothetical protein